MRFLNGSVGSDEIWAIGCGYVREMFIVAFGAIFNVIKIVLQVRLFWGEKRIHRVIKVSHCRDRSYRSIHKFKFVHFRLSRYRLEIVGKAPAATLQ